MKNKLLIILLLVLPAFIATWSFFKDDEILIVLSTGKVSKGKFIPSNDQEPRRIATIKLKESYITWKKYLDGNIRNKIHFDAALPSLQPNEMYKKNTEESDIEKHKQWVKIDIGMYGFTNQLCDKPCSRREHNQKALDYNLSRYEKLDPHNVIGSLIKRLSNSFSHGALDREFYVPNVNHDVNYIECQKQTGHYRWCNATSYLNNNMYLNYQFEYIHLDNWQEVDQKVRLMANQILVEHHEF